MVKPLASSTMTERHQVTLKEKVRKVINAIHGDEIFFYEQDYGILIVTEGLESNLIDKYQKILQLSKDLAIYISKKNHHYLLFNQARGTLFVIEAEEVSNLANVKDQILQ